jgi:hypothetical protein
MRVTLRWVATLALWALASCAPSNQLAGSLSELASLEFDVVEVHLGSGQLVVLYRSQSDAGDDVPFQLAVNVGAMPLAKGATIELGGSDPEGQPVALASRAVAGDSRGFPAILEGQLKLDSAVAVGQPTTGHFFLVFDYQSDGSLGQGRTVQGSFQATVSSS